MAKWLTEAESMADIWEGKCTITPLVECEDCKWAELCKDPELYEYKGRHGFCSRGERREDAT